MKLFLSNFSFFCFTFFFFFFEPIFQRRSGSQIFFGLRLDDAFPAFNVEIYKIWVRNEGKISFLFAFQQTISFPNATVNVNEIVKLLPFDRNDFFYFAKSLLWNFELRFESDVGGLGSLTFDANHAEYRLKANIMLTRSTSNAITRLVCQKLSPSCYFRTNFFVASFSYHGTFFFFFSCVIIFCVSALFIFGNIRSRYRNQSLNLFVLLSFVKASRLRFLPELTSVIDCTKWSGINDNNFLMLIN